MTKMTEKTETARNQWRCRSTKRVRALSRASRGFMLRPSCPHEIPASHTMPSQPAGGWARLHKTAPSPPPHLTSTPKMWRSQSGAKASLLLDSRVRGGPPRQLRVRASLLLLHLSLCLGRVPPAWRPDVLNQQKNWQPCFVTPLG